MAKYIEVPAIVDDSGTVTVAGLERDGIMEVPGITAWAETDMLALLKKQVRADDFSDDDEYLEQLIEAATEHTISVTNRTEDELRAMCEGVLPPGIVQAIILLAGHWYNAREAVSAQQMHAVPYAYETLVKRYIRLV